jgi:hypothetical protein
MNAAAHQVFVVIQALAHVAVEREIVIDQGQHHRFDDA